MDDDDKTRISVSTDGTTSSPSDNNALPNGTKLFEFEILKVLGCGGFGIVYLANDTSLNRQVALKEYMPTVFARRTSGETVSLLSPQHADTFQLGMKSFINEAQLLAQFNHHSLVKVHRFWEANGTAYMVMPFYKGNTLSVALRQMESAPDEEWLREFLSHILDALEVMHAKQCFHRDIAPDNILVVEGSNWPVLLDFGAARHVIEGAEQALTVILKPNYAPIEQYGNDDSMAQGPWTDIYSLASVIHLAIMGKVPQLAMQRMLNDRYVPLIVAAEQLMPGRYSRTFLAAIDKAISLKPNDRPQSVTQFRELLGMEPIKTGPRIAENDRREPKASSKPSTINRNVKIASIIFGFVILSFLAWVLMDDSRSLKATKVELVEKQESSARPNVTTDNPSDTPAVNSIGQYNSRAVEAVARTFDPIREFDNVIKNAFSSTEIIARLQSNKLRIGIDEMRIELRSPKSGYVYVFLLAPRHDDISLIFPHDKDQKNAIQANKKFSLPGPGRGWAFETDPPEGTDKLLVIISESPRQFDHLGLGKDGMLSLEAAKKVFDKYEASGPLFAGVPTCKSEPICSNTYSASILSVDIIK